MGPHPHREEAGKPYPKMVDATEKEDIVQFDNVTGTIVGFRTPI